MATKRAYGSGHLEPVGKTGDKWRLRIDRGADPATGKRRRQTVTFQAAGQKLANKRAAEIIRELEDSQPIRSRTTVSRLFQEYLDFCASRGRSPTTLHHYKLAFDSFFAPQIGSLPISELSAHHLDRLYTAAMTRENPLSPATVKKYHATLAAALEQAVKWDWLPVNPARKVTLPQVVHREVVAPTLEQARALVAQCQRHSDLLGAFVTTSIITGCRRGEVAALRWLDIHDDWISVHSSAYSAGGVRGIKSTKTGRERRVAIDAATVEFLKQWRLACEKRAAEFGCTLPDDAFLFSSRPDAARPMNVDTVSSYFRKAADEIGLPQFHLHSLRHFAATQLIGSGVDVRTTAAQLGHSNPSLTLRTYAHATTGQERHAANVGSIILREAT